MVALLGICGSMRKASHNRALLEAVGELLPAGASLAMWDSLDLPIFNSDLAEPAAATRLKQAIADADGLVIAVPEYNYSIPGGLKNALDWVSRPQPGPLRGKPVGLVGAAGGMSGTIRAQAHMRQILQYSDCPVLSQPEVLIPRSHERFVNGKLVDEPSRTQVGLFAAALVKWVAHHRPG